MINDIKKKIRIKSTRTFAILTSRKKRGSEILQLPPGVLKTKKNKISYINLNYKILVLQKTLENEFEFIQLIPEKYIEQAKRILKNG